MKRQSNRANPGISLFLKMWKEIRNKTKLLVLSRLAPSIQLLCGFSEAGIDSGLCQWLLGKTENELEIVSVGRQTSVQHCLAGPGSVGIRKKASTASCGMNHNKVVNVVYDSPILMSVDSHTFTGIRYENVSEEWCV